MTFKTIATIFGILSFGAGMVADHFKEKEQENIIAQKVKEELDKQK